MSSLPPVKKYLSSLGVRIYQIPCQVFETLSARVYLLLGAGPPTLVDAGSGLPSSVRDILAGFETVRQEFGENVRPSDIRRILITHGHVDHTGGLVALLREMPAEVYVHALDRTAVASPREHRVVNVDQLHDFFDRAGVISARRHELLRISPYSGRLPEGIAELRTLEDGDELDGLEIIHTPGHSPGHVCIGVGNVLLSADHILARTLPHQWIESATPYTGLGHYLESLTKIERMAGFELTLAAHEQVIHNVYRRIATIRATHRRRLDRLLEVVKAASRPMSLYEIALESYPEMTGFRAVLAMTDVGARVEYLYQRGELVAVNLDEIERLPRTAYLYRLA